MARLGAFLLSALALAAPAAQAQGSTERSVLLLLDASKSMNEAAGGGGSRLDAAKAAVGDLVDALPEDARVGMRVYGARVAEASRRAGCRDTQLVVPVGPLDRAALRSRVQALHGRGRTPIGRSLRAAADDLPAGGKRTVVLVSDGGDNCAPPDPCRAAAAVAKRGVDLTISVVGFQVNERVRRQLRCIAGAGGGSYVDAGDSDALRRELLASIARAFRDYRPVGTPVQGGAQREQAPKLAAGQYVDSIQPEQDRWYAIDVNPAQRLFASATAISPRTVHGESELRLQLLRPDGSPLGGEAHDALWGPTSEQESVVTLSERTGQVAAPGVPSRLRPGTYWLHLWLERGGIPRQDIPVELAVQPLDPGERPAFVRPPGALPTALGAARPPGATAARPRPTAQPAQPRAEENDSSPSAPALAAVGAGGLLVGLLGGRLALRGRRRG
jgi:Ca-activated chloride channel family protein